MTKRDELIALRRTMALSQNDMALELSMSLRAYQALEAGESRVRNIHLDAAKWNMLTTAVLAKEIITTTPEVRTMALAMAELIRGSE